MLEPRGPAALLVTAIAFAAAACTQGVGDDPLGGGVPAQLPIGAIGAVGADIPSPAPSAVTMGNGVDLRTPLPPAPPPRRPAVKPGETPPAPGAASAAPQASKGTTL